MIKPSTEGRSISGAGVKRRSSHGASKQRRSRQFKHYDGILAKPIEHAFVLNQNNPERPAVWFRLKRYPHSLWPLIHYVNYLLITEETEERVVALFQHFGLDPKAPFGFKDLALSLALRHRRIEFNEHGGAEFCKLYQAYNIDPASPAADRELVLALAREHVPGFQSKRVILRKGLKLERNKQTTRSKEETHALASIVVILWRATAQRGRSPSAHEITRIIRSATQPKGLSREVWQQVRKLREAYAWYDKKERTIREDVGAILKATESFAAGKVNHMQSQLIFEIAEEDALIASWLLERSRPEWNGVCKKFADVLIGREAHDLP